MNDDGCSYCMLVMTIQHYKIHDFNFRDVMDIFCSDVLPYGIEGGNAL